MNLKKFAGLGMNMNSDQFILPEGYTAVEKPYYHGDGHHSVEQLQELCRKYENYCHQQAIIKNELIKAIKSKH